MASTINGTSTGSGGLITSGDDSGILNIQTNETTAITVDASQNVGIGVTPSAWSTGISTKAIEFLGSSSVYGQSGTDIGFANNAYYNSGWLYRTTGYAAMLARASSGAFQWFTAASGTAGNAITFTQAMTLDSSGRLLVGTTTPIGSTFSTIEYSATTYNGFGLNQSTNSSGGRFMLFASQGTQCGVIDRVGSTSAVVYTTTSDRRLKENIVDAPSAIAHINAVKVRSFNWIEGGHQVKYGVIAQEFVEVEPDAVVQGDNGQTIEKSWAVDTAALVPAMIKAMQEQQAIIESLTQRITALEGA